MQDGVALERKTREELKQIALGLEIPKVSSLKKDEIISLIRQKREDNKKRETEKKEKTKWSFELLTEVFGFDKDKICSTVFEGNDSVPRDEETAGYLKQLGIKPENIFYLDKSFPLLNNHKPFLFPKRIIIRPIKSHIF